MGALPSVPGLLALSTGPPTLLALLTERPSQPAHPSDTGLLLATIVAFGTLLVLAAAATRKARNGDWVGWSCILGAFLLSWGEALYDQPFQLAFYTGGHAIWSPFGIDQPVWVPAGYAMAYGMGGWWVASAFLRGGVTRRDVLRMLVVVWLGCYAFETFAYQVGAFEYWGHPITAFGTPFWNETFNSVFIVVAGIAIAVLQPLLATAGLPARLGMSALVYLVGFTGVTYGAGFLPLEVLSTHAAGAPWMWPAVLVSQLVAVAILWVVVDLAELAPGYRESLNSGPRLLRLDHPGRAVPARPESEARP